MEYFDKNGYRLCKYDIIDLHQTVNGENQFIILNISPLDVRYKFDINRQYEYDMEELFQPSKYSGEVDFEIIGVYLE